MKQGILMIIPAFICMMVLKGCGKAENDKSDIDFRNIENLYEQPLKTIQNCVQGKWKWYVSIGCESGTCYSDNTFVDIKDDHYIVEYEGETQSIIYFTWRKHSSYLLGKETYVMWEKESDRAGWHFVSIKNDTLTVGCDYNNQHYRDVPWEFGFARIETPARADL